MTAKRSVGAMVQLHPADLVAVVVRPSGLSPGEAWEVGAYAGRARTGIPSGHKIALRDIQAGEEILKYGLPIAVASTHIRAGEHVHIQNAVMPERYDETAPEDPRRAEPPAAWSALPSTFEGYRRHDGEAGTRNLVVVAASVNCSATVVKAICRHFLGRDLFAGGIHGVVPLTHGMGCAQAIGGAGYDLLNRTLAGSIFHPNVVGAVVVGLGCEGTTFDSILETRGRMGLRRDLPLDRVGIQDSGGTEAAIRNGVEAVERLLGSLPGFRRQTLPVSQLRVALNCGGSDAFSGLTANPVLGVASDVLVSKGGTVALAEIPECHGAEGALFRRAANQSVRDALRGVFAWWHDYAARHGVSLNDNLAPGNQAGGITTIVEKSLGAVAKAGTSPLTQVAGYAEPLSRPGFALMNTPGFDPVSVTGLVSGGCNLVAFTTGRGSAYGSALAPTVKISTTSELFRRMTGDMDFDAGPVLEHGGTSQVGAELYERLVRVASGDVTASERLGLGWEDFVPWAVGETL
jgi:altronate hydrolase